MEVENEPDQQSPEPAAPTGPGGIFGLTDDEREMLREFASQLRRRDVRNQVAREALDRAAEGLEQAASSPSN